MVRTLDAPSIIWDAMSSLLASYGFQSYPIPESDESEEDSSVEDGEPRTMIQLVRGAVGVVPSHAGRSTDCFWGSVEMATTLQQTWDVLEAALKTVEPGHHSLVAWSFGPPVRTAADVQLIIEAARGISPKLRCRQFLVRPLSPGITGVRTPETALINLIGIVKVFRDVAYGDLLSELIKHPLSNSELLSTLEKQVPEGKWSSADCDRESPITQLLTRIYSEYLSRESGHSGDLTLIGFLTQLEERNNLSGLSDQALVARLAADPSVRSLPSHIRKLVARHQQI